MMISVVVPVYNEEAVLPELMAKIEAVLASHAKEYELVFVNDASTDRSAQIILESAQINPRIRLINFERNSGQGKALEEGFRACRGEILVSIDADLQNDPADLPLLVAKIEKGYDLVCGWRFERNDSALKNIKSRFANFLQRRIIGLPLHDMSCTFRAYRREVLKGITFPGRFDFSLLPYIISKHRQVRIAEIRIRHFSRKHGHSSYRFMDTVIGTTISFFRVFFQPVRIRR
jgi:glycosyltransferase involved in cell wall biosynthesis